MKVVFQNHELQMRALTIHIDTKNEIATYL